MSRPMKHGPCQGDTDKLTYFLAILCEKIKGPQTIFHPFAAEAGFPKRLFFIARTEMRRKGVPPSLLRALSH